MKYKHFSVEEREIIQTMWWERKSIRSIAAVLGRSHTSVSREMKRNFPQQHKVYAPRLAEARAVEKRKSRGRKDRLKNAQIKEYVITHLKRRWSPEQISIRIKMDIKETISHEAIYQYIYGQIHRHGHGYVKPGCEDLRAYLRRRRKKRMRKGMQRPHRALSHPGKSIEERPKIVDRRTRIGDWEGDTVESINHRPGVNTLLERKTGMFLVTKVKDKTSKATAEAVAKRMQDIPDHLKHTLTTDNGFENGAWRSIEETTGLSVYFAHAYASHERGANENANGLLRDYFPKKTDFATISDDELSFVERELNNRPRKRHGGLTPLEVMGGALAG
jgi:IS30 family transposase